MGLFFNDRAPRRRIEPKFSASAVGMSEMTMAESVEFGFDWRGNGATFGGPVSEHSAMTTSAVYACVSLVAGIIAGLPLKVYRRTPDGYSEEAPNHRLTPLLGQTPYPGRPLTSFNWRETMSANIDLWGNHFSWVQYDNAARVTGFVPIMPWRTEIYRRNYNSFYVFTLEDGTRTDAIPAEDVIHVSGLGFDGICGESRIRHAARNAVGLAKVLEDQTGYSHENGAKLSGMVSVGSNILPEGLKRMKAEFNGRLTGTRNAGKVVFADQGATFTPFQMTPEDLNTLQFRKFQVVDICRFFGVHPTLVFESADSTMWGSGVEQLMLAFRKFKLEETLGRIEAELNAKLFAGTQFFCRHDREQLHAMSALELAQSMQAQINSGLMTPNEGRKKFNRPAVKGGDTLFLQSAMAPIDRLINPPTPAPAPAPTSATEPKEPTK